jgi:uncharacterized OsmC-like protein
MSDIRFEAQVEWKEGFTVEARARDLTLYIDEPPNLGGKDKGPNPVEYVLMALGGCVVIVGQVVAKEMGIKIDDFKIRLSGDLNPLKFMGKPSPDRAGFKSINLEIEVKSDAPREKLEEWVKAIEERCPVGDNLRNPTPVHIVIK